MTDHFSSLASQYARFRPTYPKDLFQFLADNCSRRDVAWDCGTGSGQAAFDLAEHFGVVIATDLSDAQLREARQHPNITYRVARAEECGLEDNSVDLVTVAEAFHWFDANKFFSEVSRVVRQGGKLAIWSYAKCSFGSEALDSAYRHFYDHIIEPYWPPERKFVEEGYRSIQFPIRRIETPSFEIRMPLRVQEYTGYVRSWSGVKRFIEQNGFSPVDEIENELSRSWGHEPRTVVWPLTLHFGDVVK